MREILPAPVTQLLHSCGHLFPVERVIFDRFKNSRRGKDKQSECVCVCVNLTEGEVINESTINCSRHREQRSPVRGYKRFQRGAASSAGQGDETD